MAARSSAAVQIAAPQRVPVRPARHISAPHLVPAPPRSRAVRRQMARRSRRSVLKIAAASLCMLIMLSLLIFERAQLISLNIKKAEAEERLRIAQSETVRLESEFNSMVSVENVEEYAKNKLGMVKRQGQQMQFFRNQDEDEIVLINPMEE